MEILKFDSALEVLYLNKDQSALSITEIRKRIPFKIPEEELSMMLDKIRGENLVSQKMKDSTAAFFITYEGMKFYQKGGYLKATIRNFFKKLLKLSLVALGVISTVIGIILGLRELL